MNWGAGANPRGVDRGIIRRMRTGWLRSKPNTILRSAGNANPNPILSFYEKRIVAGMMRNISGQPAASGTASGLEAQPFLSRNLTFPGFLRNRG
jgi:hypothetical protein